MAKRNRRRRKQGYRDWATIHPGLPPGTLVAEPDAAETDITVFAYDETNIVEQTVTDTSKLAALHGKWDVIWINIEGLGNVEVIGKIGKIFGIHELALEDSVTANQRAKVEMFGDSYFLIAHMVESKQGLLGIEQVSMFISHGVVITFQEGPIDSFEPVRDRLRKNQGKIRGSGADYLAYRLLDVIIDGYFPVLEEFGEKLEGLEDEILEKPNRATVAQVHETKRDFLALRRTIWPLRDAISTLLRDSSSVFDRDTLIFLRDCHDHTIQIADLIENYREIGSDLMDVYLSSLSNRLSEVMKVLTVITTLCAPPTLVAGIYGMNFKTDVSPFNMPELSWYFGYPFALVVMLILAVGTIWLVNSKGWLGAGQQSDGAGDPLGGAQLLPTQSASATSSSPTTN